MTDSIPLRRSLCWMTTPCGGWGSEAWVGYVWAIDISQAKRIAVQTEPSGEAQFTDFRFLRCSELDGLLPAERAAWDANGLPPEHRHLGSSLWNPSPTFNLRK